MKVVNKSGLFKTNVKKTLKAWQLYVLLIPALLWAVIFAYYPMYGVVIAFKDYKIRAGILGSPWADPILKYFQQFFSTSIALNAIKNTIVISLESLVIAFPIPIIFALLLNQIQGNRIKKTIQTISYAPYFMSNVVVVSIISVFFAANGVVNNLVTSAGGKETLFTSLPEWFRTLFIGSNIWQTMGFNAVIFIAALTAISPDYYEAATIDGASRFQRILYIDIPMILPTIILMLILQIGRMFDDNFDQIYNLYSPSVYEVSDVFETYVYRNGIQQSKFSYSAAVGLVKSVLALAMIMFSNKASKKLGAQGLF